MRLECGWRHVQKRWAENLRILKKRQLKVDIGPCRQIVEFSAIGAESWGSTVAAAVKFFGSRPAKINWDLKHHKLHVGEVSIVKNCASLLVLKNWNQKLIKPFRPEQQSPPISAFVHVYVRWIDIVMIMVVVYNTPATFHVEYSLWGLPF